MHQHTAPSQPTKDDVYSNRTAAGIQERYEKLIINLLNDPFSIYPILHE